jgi:conjugative relaxase-like TrwC/TraI family protein
MLRIVQNISAAGAKSYYSTADYYTEGQELNGFWRGEGASRLGLAGTIGQKAWDALCDNRDPNTGLPFTVRRKQERRVGYDFNFHAPKSVSLLYGLTRDERLLEAFRTSVDETMREMEAEMQTRVRRSGKNEDRTTGNALWGEFIHFTSRPVGGIPDPHLHAHCFTFNSTWDDIEQRWKAGQFAGLKRDAPYFEAVFQSKLAQRVSELGLGVERTKTGWEIGGFDKATLMKFSRRTAQIEATAKAKGITSEAEKAGLGAKTREKKATNLTMDELRAEWRERLTGDEQRDARAATEKISRQHFREHDRSAQEAVIAAMDHCFERESVVPERKLLREALRRSYGQASRKAVEQHAERQKLIRAEQNGRNMVTSNEVLAEEAAMLAFARSGKGSLPPLVATDHVFRREWLNAGQKKAVNHVLESYDRVILVRGAAGTGKTTMMSEAVEAIEATGKHVFTFAPSAGASRGVLADAGFKDADTVARLLADEKLQQQLRGQVMWIDEASLLGVRTMKRVFDLADELDCRVVLQGDRRQHGSVERGAALRLLETEAGLIPAEITDIQRQKGRYRRAVALLSEGHVADGFRQLDAMGCIKEFSDEERYKALAREYLASAINGQSALVVSPTHLESEWVTGDIRSSLREAGLLGTEQRQFHVLENANLTTAERSDATNYMPGDTIVFHQNAPGFRKGDRVVAGNEPMPLQHATRFTTFHTNIMPLSPGDRIRVTQNGKTKDEKHRMNNGDLFTVKSFSEAGDIELSNGWTIDKDFGHLTHGYVVTSHASQGKSVKHVIIAQSSASAPASSREQFYVSVSRGQEAVTVFTDDRDALLEAVCKGDERLTATEFVAIREHQQRALIARQVLKTQQPERPDQRARERGQIYER